MPGPNPQARSSTAPVPLTLQFTLTLGLMVRVRRDLTGVFLQESGVLKSSFCLHPASDYTLYPFSTQNPKDFQNLLSVYLDATFFPCLRELDFWYVLSS